MLKKTIPSIVLGGAGYVAGEMLGLLLNHPSFFVETVVSSTHQGERVDCVFPHLTGVAGDQVFAEIDSCAERLQGKRQVALFSALPHGESAKILDQVIGQSPAVRVLDVSADFRFSDPDQYERIYGRPHPAPDLLKRFTCALPDLARGDVGDLVSHPGCFSTGISLGLAGLREGDWIEPEVQVSAVTGSTGAGRQLGPGTHHPHRQSSMWAYQPLHHRHQPEVETLLPGLKVAFVPHSGPFSRGIHSTIFARLKRRASAEELADALAEYYASTPFVKVSTQMPTLKEVVGTNRCHLGVAVADGQLVVTSVIDNLVKGAAGGAVQWMNRLFSLDEKEGLVNAVPGWI
ncbi:MAG: N-acetyl-gamma-glutamyl-phosphate reductase [Fimbriimonadaceae bacterium]|nr:MAG: N-acetyl-gamma-glutamyl-phosphate reductase [Fimbriimonadaceae bacterium]